MPYANFAFLFWIVTKIIPCEVPWGGGGGVRNFEVFTYAYCLL